MQGNGLLLIAALLPMLAAPCAYGLSRKKAQHGIWMMIATCAVTLGLVLGLMISAQNGANQSFMWAGFCGLGLWMRADGFRALYAVIAGGMWLVTSVFSRDYFGNEHNVGRYLLFTLLTFGATVGMFLSDTLYSLFLFFEMMSLFSYPWVAQEETPEAMRAAQTYLYIAIIGGLVMLMGLLLLPEGIVDAPFAQLPALAGTVGTDALWMPALLLLFGFGAKAGSFPLHIWLPKAHPVSPAPASALLSGMLTKAGIFGMLILTCLLMRRSVAFAELIFRLGVITMLLGAVLALFSVNLKRTLACSSLSQIGFIMVGVGLCGLLGEENSMAAIGTVGHMVNHSLFKLVLFLCAGVVAMNTHKLALDDIRGYGRGKPVLHFAFLMGLLGISGIPLFSGYVSKSLLHEGLLEYIAHLQDTGADVGFYQFSEWVFLISGGLTLCYMLKLYVCLFWQKHPTQQAVFGAQKKYLSPLSCAVLSLCAAVIPAIGMLPGILMTGIGKLSASFLNAAVPAHTISYFSGENLLGAGKSLLMGGIFYVGMRLWLTKRTKEGSITYLDCWPAVIDLENMVYRPLLNLMCWSGYGIASVLDKLMDWVIITLRGVGLVTARVLDGLLEGLALLARKTVLLPICPKKPIPVGTRATYALGMGFDGAVALLNRTIYRAKPIETSFVGIFAAGREEITTQFKQLTQSVSFGLLMFCLGLFATLVYLLFS